MENEKLPVTGTEVVKSSTAYKVIDLLKGASKQRWVKEFGDC